MSYSRFLVSESRKEAYYYKKCDSSGASLERAKLDGLNGQRIKDIHGPYPAPLVKDLKERAGETMPDEFDWTEPKTFYILTETGKLYWYWRASENDTEIVEEFPFMHSEIREID